VDENEYGRTRDELYEHLKSYNYFGRRYFYPLISTFNMYKSLPSADLDNLPVATRIADQVICLPIYPDLDMGHVENVVSIIREASGKR
jgi:dTDP-4-amino-4,6-dideoxygalactose transaminase